MVTDISPTRKNIFRENMLIYPWGYGLSIFTPDSAIFVNYARLMTRDNDYIFGTGDQTVGYYLG